MNATTGRPAIKMRDVTVGPPHDVTLPGLTAVNWTVAPGEFWVVAGLQHSGKTDLLMLAAGLLPPQAGSYELFGRETREFGEAELAERLRVAYVFENGRLFGGLTIAENIALPLRYHRNLAEAEAESETRALLERLELTPFAGLMPARVSRDWLKRAALARALVLQPQVLLCDNPLSGLGRRHRQWWLEFLDREWRGDRLAGGEPMTVVVTTEDLAPWKNSGRRFALLRDQRFWPLGAWAEAIQSTDPVVREWLATSAETTL